MAFYVFYAKPMRRARIHKGDCKYCRDGQGMENQHKTGSGATGWEGPFAKLEEANACMTAFRYEDSQTCKYCLG
jgi:hypothetical protein